MEPESDPMVEDNAHLGKRKRSPENKLHPKEDMTHQALEDHNESPSGQGTVPLTPKRKRVESTPAHDDTNTQNVPGPDRIYGLTLESVPLEILQHTLTFMEPYVLGRLMRVNKYFNSLLDPRQRPTKPSGKTRLPLLNAELIWSSSRRSYLHGVPHPLKSLTELDMLRLLYGRRCQICGKLPQATPSRFRTTPWDSGPGPLGVRTIWPFKIRTCAECLKPLLRKETELTHPGYSQLLNGLLAATFSPSLNYVMSISLTQTVPPSGLQLTRYYYQKDIDDLSRQASTAHALGNAAYERWCHELDALKQDANTDVLRLEAWELSQKATSSSLAISSNVTSRSSASGSSVYSDGRAKSYATAPSGGLRAQGAVSTHSVLSSTRLSNSLSRVDTGKRPLLSKTEFENTYRRAAEPPRMIPPLLPADHPDKSFPLKFNQQSPDITRLKSEKQADIQRRCLELVPPITVDVLHHLPAFEAALRVLMPLTDASWETLKIQLLNQSHSIPSHDLIDHDCRSQADILDAASIGREATPGAGPVEIDLRKQALRPVREKLYEFAREYVHRRYADGTGLTHSSAPQFAADVLLYVRQRYYENQQQEDAVFAADGERPPEDGPSGIRARVLRLEHMRHVFDTSIKPFTEFVRKDLFLCSACDTQGRHFAFEAIIQHYASKHTDTFSRGAAVVYWKAVWPEVPPFHPNPSRDVDSAPSATQTVSAQASETTQANYLGGLNHPRNLSENDDGNSVRGALQRSSNPWRPTAGEFDSLPEIHRYYPTAPVPITQYYDAIGMSQHSQIPPNNLLRNRDGRGRDASEEARLLSKFDPSRLSSEAPLHIHRSYPVSSMSQGHEQYDPDIPMTEADDHLNQRYEYLPSADPVRSGLRLTNASYGPRLSDHLAEAGHRPVVSEYRFTPPTGTRTYDRPSPDASYGRGTPNMNQREPSARRESPPAAIHSQPRNAAERFLDSFDIVTNPDIEKQPSRPISTQSSRPLSRDNSERRAEVLDSRSNMSQSYRHVRMNSANDHEQHVEDYNRYNIITRNSQNIVYDHPPVHHLREERSYHPHREGVYHEEPAYNMSPDQRPRFYDTSNDASRFTERHYSQPRARYMDQYGREIHSLSPEVIYTERPRYQEVRPEREIYFREPQAMEVRYEYLPYDQREPTQNTETRRYYIERPVREDQVDYRYEENEQQSRRNTMREPEETRHHHHGSSRPHMSDQRYRRG